MSCTCSARLHSTDIQWIILMDDNIQPDAGTRIIIMCEWQKKLSQAFSYWKHYTFMFSCLSGSSLILNIS